MSARSFVHLHCHSHYSLLDGASSIDRLVERAKTLGMNGLALTDHGNLHGALEFYQKSKKAGINPIIGYEAYVAPGARRDRDAQSSKEATYHLTLLAKNATGFRNLVKLASAAYLEGFYFKPRIDKELLEAHHEGIICLSGCVSGEFSRILLRGGDTDLNLREAMDTAAWFNKLFGEDYFIEIQNNGLEIQRLAAEGAIEVANRMGLPLVATSDAHYVNREDAEAQDVLLCINTGKFRTDTNRMRMEGDQFFLRAPEEMYAAFPGHAEAVARSQEIADRVSIDLDLKRRCFPVYSPPDDQTPTDYLRELCLKGLQERYAGNEEMRPGGELAPKVMERLEHELFVINKLGFPNYFLIVWDFVRYARSQSIPATARGSGVGALVSYSLYLSHVCPIKYDLLFERFLDLSREEAPDIDIDFCQDRRGECIQYVKDKYGEANVAQIGTFGTLAARAAIRDVGRALGVPIPGVDRIVAMVPDDLGIKLEKALEQSAELKQAYDNDAEVHELLNLAMKIEGLARNVGTHAAAVVIADKPLVEYVPLCRVSGKNDVITQWSMGDVEKAGLLKMDFLGLRNLTILAKTVELVKQSTGQDIDPLTFPLDDKASYALLCRGETKGVFQLESGGIRDLLTRMKPDCFNDIIATNALYRPGPLEGGMVDQYVECKHGRRDPTYPHPVMKDVLEETHGVMVYQEQVMRILNRLGGIELADAYKCIKAISKKKLETIAKYREQFVNGANEQGLAKSAAADLFSMIEKFAGYGFNKSHSTAYALIAYQTAYLKAHYPVQFMAALLTGDISGRNFKTKDRLVEHLEDCSRMNVEVAPPDVNESGAEFAVVVAPDGTAKIRFGLSALKGCGGSAADGIVAARQKDGPFTDIFEFCSRVDTQLVNRTAIESLIKAGAFDSLGAKRSQQLAVLDKAIQSGVATAADRRAGQRGLFDDVSEEAAPVAASLPNIPEWDEKEKLCKEKEVLGFYLTSHPLAEHAETLRSFCTHTSPQLADLPHRTEVLVGGMLSALKFSNTKNPRPGSVHTKYVMFDLEDLEGMVRTIVWPEEFAVCGQLAVADAIVAIRGVIDRRPGSEDVNLIANELIPLEELSKRFTRGMVIRLDEAQHTERGMVQLHEILRGYPGSCDVQLVVQLTTGQRVLLKSEKLRVDINAELRRRVDDLLGPGNLKLVAAPPKPTIRNGNGNGRQFARRN